MRRGVEVGYVDFWVPSTCERTLPAASAPQLLQKNVSLKHLQLARPEQQGYQPWLDHMAKHGFPQLEDFHYMVPRKRKGESEELHEQRQEKALQTILTALRNGKLPALKSLVIQGFGTVFTLFDKNVVPARFVPLVTEIENAVANQQQPGFIHYESSTSLSTLSASSSNEVSSKDEYAIRCSSAESPVASRSHSPISSSPEERFEMPLAQAVPSAPYVYYL